MQSLWNYIDVKIQLSNPKCKTALRRAQTQSLIPKGHFNKAGMQSKICDCPIHPVKKAKQHFGMVMHCNL